MDVEGEQAITMVVLGLGPFCMTVSLVGNVGDMSGHVCTTPTVSAKNQPMSNVADAVTGFMAGSRVGLDIYLAFFT